MNVLLVEDHGESRTVLANLLTHCGHEIAVAANLREALVFLRNWRFDALLSDLGLPDGEAFALANEAKKSSRLKTAVALTGRETEADRERARLAGFDHYFTKPFDFGELRAVLAA